MYRLLLRIFLSVSISACLCAQNRPFLARSVKASILEYDLKKQAIIFRLNEEKYDEAAKLAVTARLAPYYGINDIWYLELDAAQYEVCCGMFNLDPKPKQKMLVLYFNGNAVQLPADKKDVDLVREFRKLGWVPLDVRLDEFIKTWPYNQDALAMRFSETALKLQDLASASRRAALPAALRTQLPLGTRDQEADAKAVALFLDALKSINELKTLDWLSNSSLFSSTDVLGRCTHAPILKENKELQKELQALLESLGKEISRYPYVYFNYTYWSGISAIAKDADPFKMISQIKLLPAALGGSAVHDFVSNLAEPFFFNPLFSEDGVPIVDDGFKFLADAAEWMLEQDPALDGVFSRAFSSLAVTKAQKLIWIRRYSELEKHLEDTWQIVGPNWPTVVNGLKNPAVRSKFGDDYTDLPATNKKRVDAILDLAPRPEVKKPPAAASESDPELSGGLGQERRNLVALERFIKRNPDTYYAMDKYCRDAAKLLPDEELEKNIYNYTRITHTPPSLAAYSNFHDKENWTRLASQVIVEGLLRLSDAPTSGYEGNRLWKNLSSWEDLDLDKNAIDWYAFIKNTVFWYHPMYYLTRNGMPEVVFVKYLGQAERAMDWASVLAVCEARYRLDKKNCQSETILAAWKKAEEKMGRQSRL